LAGLDRAGAFVDSAAAGRARPEILRMKSPAESPRGRRVNWTNVVTVLSAAILISAEVFGAAFAGGWALAVLMGLGDYGVYALQIVFFLIGMAVMASFIRGARRVEPFTSEV
jgi:hypothetical protein